MKFSVDMITPIGQLSMWKRTSAWAVSLLILSLALSCSPELKTTETIAELPKSSATLSVSESQVSAGETVDGTITISLQEGWHTYGNPPGDSGMPPKVSVELPDGWEYKQRPLPPTKEFRDAVGVSNGYEGKLDISFQLTAPSNAMAGTTAEISFDLEWLVCKEICIPMSDTLSTTLTITKK